MFAILMLSIVGTGCDTGSVDAKQEKIMLAELAKLIHADFPSDTKLLYYHKEDRTVSKRYVVYSSKPVQFKKRTNLKIPAQSIEASLKAIFKWRKFGALKDQWAYFYEGGEQKSSWNLHQTNFESGSYLYIWRHFFATAQNNKGPAFISRPVSGSFESSENKK